MVIPISQASREYANGVRKAIRARHFFVDVDHGDNKMEKKIRDAQLEQYNYILVRLPRIGHVATWNISPSLISTARQLIESHNI